MTCNPKITSCSFENQKPHDWNDITRVFHLKVKKLIGLIVVDKIFGEISCYMYTIEWQKRGLPHVHLLVWLKTRLRPNDIDHIVSGESPNPQEYPLLCQIVMKNMMHGPCGQYNINSPCMKYRKCTKRFPKLFTSETRTGEDGYSKYIGVVHQLMVDKHLNTIFQTIALL